MTDEEELDAAQDKDTSDSGKLKTLMGILKRMVGVKDMAAIRLSLPANLLEPVPNLEYWNYLDRGDIFTSIGDMQDPLDRMLQVLRFTFTKELKFVHGKVCKPYNSILGEHFRCHWDVQGMQVNDAGELVPTGQIRVANATPLPLASSSGKRLATSSSSTSSRPSSIKSGTASTTQTESTAGTAATTPTTEDAPSSKKPKGGLSRFISKDKVPKLSSNSTSNSLAAPSSSTARPSSIKSPALSATSIPEGDALAAGTDRLSLGANAGDSSPSSSSSSSKRITFLTEQVSHHPPISSFFVECKEAGVQLSGVDQLSAKFTGTSVRVFPGEHNKGIFLNLTEQSAAPGEEYQITHPTASLNGLLRGSLWVAICDTLYISQRGSENGSTSSSSSSSPPRLRSIVEYKDESWLMKAKYALEGVIYEWSGGEGETENRDDSTTANDGYKTIKEVPSDKVVATFEGTWRGKITFKRRGEKESHLLINLDEIDPLPKTVRPLQSQETWESRRIWETVTSSIISKDFSAATRNKQRIEQMQRDAAAQRKRAGEEYTPRFFNEDIANGRPTLTAQGKDAMEGERQLKGYGQGQNTPEDTREKAQRNAVLRKGERLGATSDASEASGASGVGAPSGVSGAAAGSGSGKKDGEEDEDDGDGDDDGASFRSAED